MTDLVRSMRRPIAMAIVALAIGIVCAACATEVPGAAPTPSVTAGGPVASHPTVDPSTGEIFDPERMQAQSDLLEIAQPIQAIADPTDGAENRSADGIIYGLAGLRITPENYELQLFWKGDVPPNIQKILDSAPDRVLVTIIPARFNTHEMWNAVDDVMAEQARAGELVPGVTLEGGAITLDGSGISMAYSLDSLTPGVGDERAISKVAGMPVTLVPLSQNVDL